MNIVLFYNKTTKLTKYAFRENRSALLLATGTPYTKDITGTPYTKDTTGTPYTKDTYNSYINDIKIQ